MNDATIIKDCAPVAVAVPDALRALVEAIEFSPLGIRQIKALEQARAALAATPAAAPVVPKWIDDPHDIEQGQMLNPEWVKVQEVASAPAAAAPVELPEPDALVTRKIGDICSFYSMTARKGDKLYSEQQVRALLAQAAAPAAPDLKRENANLYEALAWWRRDAKIRGAAARLLMENLSDEDRLGDGRINTTRVRELLEPITRDTDEQSRDLGDSPATAAPAAPAVDALDAKDRECIAIGRAIQRAAGELPVDGEIRIDIENGAGAVYVLEPKHGDWRYIDSGDVLSAQINEAIDAANAAAKGAA